MSPGASLAAWESMSEERKRRLLPHTSFSPASSSRCVENSSWLASGEESALSRSRRPAARALPAPHTRPMLCTHCVRCVRGRGRGAAGPEGRPPARGRGTARARFWPGMRVGRGAQTLCLAGTGPRRPRPCPPHGCMLCRPYKAKRGCAGPRTAGVGLGGAGRKSVFRSRASGARRCRENERPRLNLARPRVSPGRGRRPPTTPPPATRTR